MGYKTFGPGEEALAADVNNLYMSQTVSRFASASSRTAAISAPAINQLSVLDAAKGAPDYFDGSAWKSLGVTYERFVFQSYGSSVAGVGQELSQATFTMPFNGVILISGNGRVSPWSGQTAPVMNALFDYAPSSTPSTGVAGGQYVSPGLAATNMLCIVPYAWACRGVAAGTACNIKVRVGTNVATMTLDWLQTLIRLVPAEF